MILEIGPKTAMHTQKIFLAVILGASVLISLTLQSCAGNSTASSPQGTLIYTAAAQTKTAVAQTLQAQLTEFAAAGSSTPTPLPAGNTPGASASPTPSPPPGTSATPGPTSNAACDKAAFVEDITVPDGTVFEPGETFVKTWRLKNTGLCTWNSQYAIVFDKGNPMGSPASFPFPAENIPPGAEVDLSVTLQAPTEAGEYRADWKLRNPAGQTFGLGASSNSTFWVVIQVASPPEFSVFFDNVHACDGTPHAIFSVFNDGDSPLQSAEITLTHPTTGATLFGPYAHNGPFMGGANQCPPGGDKIDPGKKGYLGASLATVNSGQNLQAAFKICTQDELGGSCLTETLTFTP